MATTTHDYTRETDGLISFFGSVARALHEVRLQQQAIRPYTARNLTAIEARLLERIAEKVARG